MKYSHAELESALSEVNNKANSLYAFIGALIGALPATALFFLYAGMGGALYIMLAIPPLIVGVFYKIYRANLFNQRSNFGWLYWSRSTYIG